MRRSIVVGCVVAVLLVAGAAGAGAQFRLDGDVNVPVYLGLTLNGTQQGVWNEFFIPFPDVQLIYQFGLGPVKLGVGARVFTLIIENFAYPEVMAEFDLGPAVLYANVGGFLLVEFGLLTSTLQAAGGINTLTGFHEVVMADVGAALKVSDWFRVCAGVYMISPFTQSLGGVLDNNVFAGYVSAKFVALFK